MFDPNAITRIARSGMLGVVRRVLFTSTNTSQGATAFDFESFYQFGTGIVVISMGKVYVLSPSHVIRNATGNQYINDSPFWLTAQHKQPKDLIDFLMPMRICDLSPDGETDLDAAFVEMNDLIMNLGPYLDWDDQALFLGDNESFRGATAIVMGYPEEVNAYDFLDMEDGSVQQVANIRHEGFHGVVYEDTDGCWFNNFNHREGYIYPGLSGGIVVCNVDGCLKYLGMVVSNGDGGKRFKVLKFTDLRKAVPEISRLPWDIVDEAYFLKHRTMSTMNYAQFQDRFFGSGNFVPVRSNEFIEQMIRALDSPRRRHWFADPEQALVEATGVVRRDFCSVLAKVVSLKAANAQKNTDLEELSLGQKP